MMSEPKTITLRAVMTCGAFPEQYEVYCPEWGDKQVGYMRMRWGVFTVECPDACGEQVFRYEFENDPYLGEFPNDETREHFLSLGIIAIKSWLEEHTDFVEMVKNSSNLMKVFNPIATIETGRDGTRELKY